MYKEQLKKENGILSAVTPQTKIKTTTDTDNKTLLQTQLRQKKNIKIYTDENKFYIERSTAFALGIINTNSMMSGGTKYILLNDIVHNILKKDNDLEIEYVDMIKDNEILSAINPTPVLDAIGQNNSQTTSTQKQILKVYVEGEKYYIDNSAAHALGITKVRAVKLGGPHFIEITEDILNKLKSNNRLEIEFEKITKKFKLKVYNDGNNFYIDNAAAYALGFLSVEDFHKSTSNYFLINEHLLKGLSLTYEIEINNMSLEAKSESKTK